MGATILEIIYRWVLGFVVATIAGMAMLVVNNFFKIHILYLLSFITNIALLIWICDLKLKNSIKEKTTSRSIAEIVNDMRKKDS